MGSEQIDNGWSKVSELLATALALPHEQRAAWLAALRGPDEDLREFLRRLLEVQAGHELVELRESPVAVAPLRGHCIGPWRLLHPLGTGGMSAVWLAEHVDRCLAATAALKLPRPLCNGLHAARLSRECDILRSLQHRHIARLYEAGIDANGCPYLALEHVAGARIDTHCECAHLDRQDRVTLFLQVVDAVQHAHTRQVIHRDLKPANVLIDAGGEARLVDFGIAVSFGERDTPLPAAMTPRYASPEQLQGRRVGMASDIYSLGVMLYELLTGESPYALTTATPTDWAACILNGHFRRGIDPLIVRALARNPAARYPSAKALSAALHEMS